MDADIEKFIQSCLPCTAARPGRQYEPVKSTPLPKGPWQVLNTDFKGPIERDWYVLVIVDAYSRYPEMAVVNSTEAATVIPKFDEIISRHGILEEVISDSGPLFDSTNWELYSKGVLCAPGHSRYPMGKRSGRKAHENGRQTHTHISSRRKGPESSPTRVSAHYQSDTAPSNR